MLEGTPYGLRYADIRTRSIRALVCPRTSIKRLLSRPEMDGAGIYLLIDRSTGELPQVYIGESDQ